MAAARGSAFAIAATYGLVGAAWMLLSDILLARLAPSRAVAWLGGLAKGLGFVVVTALLLYAVLRRFLTGLDESRGRYQVMAEHISDVITLLDRRGRLTYVSPSVERLRGITAAEDLAQAPEDRLTPDSLARARVVLADVLAQEDDPTTAREWVRTLELEFRRADGSTVWAETRFSPLRGPDGALTGFVAVSRDITERRRAEEQLRLQAAALSAAANAILITDVEGRIQWANPAFETLTGYAPDAVVGQTPRFLRSGEHDAEFYRDLWATIRAGQVFEGEIINRRRDGTHYVERQTITPVRGADGQVSHFIAIKVDVTERRRADEELARQRERLYQTEKVAAMGQLLAGVAHELNNPLAVVVGRAALLEEQTGGTAVSRSVRSLGEAAERCARIIRNFLAMARQHPPERQRVRLNQVIQEAVELVAYGLRVDGVEVALEFDLALPIISADPHQLHQVVVNLVTNAHHAMRELPHSHPRRLRLRTATLGEQVVLGVSDTGPGMSPEVVARLFEPFFTTKPVGQGTGLGLSLARGIVEAHGGAIDVESTPGQGATFRVRLPIGAGGDPEVAGTGSTLPPIGSLRILVIDDEPAVAETLAEILTRDGHIVDAAPDGAAGLARLTDAAYDVIFSDLRMPKLDGPAFYARLARDFPEAQRRVAFITGDTLTPQAATFLEAARRPALQKPFSPEDVRRVVRRILAERPADA